MPSGTEVQQYFTGVWRMMMGRTEGLKLLDLSADGFWNSFFAIVIALPALIVGWVGLVNGTPEAASSFAMRFSLITRFFLADIGSWIVPLALFAALARPAGIGDRLVHYVVATNWASALLAWVMLPPSLMQLFIPDAENLTVLIALVLSLVTLVLLWRLTVVAIAKGPAVGSAVYFAMLVASALVLFALKSVLLLDI